MPETYLKVAVPVPVRGTFTYSVPDDLLDRAVVGSRVLVPFGRRRLTGFVVGTDLSPDVKGIKNIIEVLDVEPMVSEKMLELTRWIADYYLSSWGEVLKSSLPPGISMESRRCARLTETGRDHLREGGRGLSEERRRVLEILFERGEMSLAALGREAGIPRSKRGDVSALERAGAIEFFEEVRQPRTEGGRERVVRLIGSPEAARSEAEGRARRAPKQAELLTALADEPDATLPVSELAARGIGSATVARLIDKGLIERGERDRPRLSTGLEGWDLRDEGPLTSGQSEALDLVRRRLDVPEYGAVLVHGVTGSGKTRIYVEAVREALERGRGAIVLVPEIALTPQVVVRLRKDFGDRVAVLHSGLSLGARYDTWRAIREGLLPVVVGPRSAVFAPVPDLGVIVVDEEHEGTYKQSDSPRYHARDVAIMRARLERAVVLLGSATPSMESYRNAREGKYGLVELSERIDSGPLPEVEIVDMREQTPVDSEGAFSAPLRDAVAETLSEKRQVILFLNRRGYASFVQCLGCGYSPRCSECSISMTYHSIDRTIRCHYCGRVERAPERCPSCGGMDLRFGAPGTQRVEHAVMELFPDASVQRMDVDSTERHGSHWRILKAFADGRIDILLGTQMIAKGLDFPRVGLVGVVAADVGLNLPDFRSGERTFQLLTQVAGRTGRGDERGRVVVQTYLPEHYTIALAREQRYLPFFEREAEERRALGLGYPPFVRLVSILVRGEDRRHVMDAAEVIAGFLEQGAATMREPAPEILGPAPAPLERIKGFYRWQVLVRGGGGDARALVEAVLAQKGALKLPSAVTLAVDVDPVDLL